MGKYNVNEGNQIGYMPTEFDQNGNLVETKLVAGADLTAGQVVELTGSMIVTPTTAASAKVLGVAMFDTKKDQPTAVECEGLFKLTASGAITAGDHVASAADGKVAKGTDNTIGIALNTAADGEGVFVKFSI